MKKRPNVLLVCVDQWSGLLTRMAGHPAVRTPTVAQLAREGVNFTNAYSACPTCIPARRTLHTGLTARTHGDRAFTEAMPLPENAPTLAGTFREHGYQCFAVGKMHFYPQRERGGFNDVILNEEGRHHLGMSADDWELYLSEKGFTGREYETGVCNNDYLVHPWHLPEECHPSCWTAREMCRTIRRRDPRKPSFWFLSFACPHPPLMPPAAFLDLYRDEEIDLPVLGDWSREPGDLPWAARQRVGRFAMDGAGRGEIVSARRGFYASITHVDYQLRVVIGFLREEKLLEDTVIAFVCDHGDMLGDHHLWAKGVMFEKASRIPFFFVPAGGGPTPAPAGSSDDRLVELVDVMPTLLEAAGLPVPGSCEGLSLLGRERRPFLYGEHYEGSRANRMIREGDFKLIYFPAGNRRLLFDTGRDPLEQRDLSGEKAHAETLARLTGRLVENLYGSDLEWLDGDRLAGLPEPGPEKPDNRGLAAQRGLRLP